MARNRALASARKAYRKSLKARSQKSNKPRKQEERKSKPNKPKTDVSSQYKSYKSSSFAPQTKTSVKPKQKQTSLQKAQSAFERGQKVRASQQKRNITNTSVTKPKEYDHKTDVANAYKKGQQARENLKKGNYDYKADVQKAYKKGSNTTTLGTKQKETTTTLKTKKEQKQEYKQSKTQYYKSKDWKNTKNDLKVKNQEGWRKALSDQGWSRAEIDAWMNSEEGMKNRRETYMESKDAVKKAINKEIAKGIKDTSKLKSVNALTRGEFNQMVTANAMGKKRGNKYLETSGKRLGTEDIREKIGSKTAESAYKSKFMTGALQGSSYADLFSGSVGKYNAGAREAIQQTKDSGAYLAGYGVGLAGQMAMGNVASRGASLAEMAGQGAGRLFGRGVAKEVPAKALQEATEEVAKVSAKQGAKRFAQNRAGELLAETPVNVLDAVKMSLDVDGNLDKKEFKKWLLINSGATFGIGGAMEGIGAGATRKLATETLDLMAKKEAGNITPEELAQLEKNAKKLSQKTKGNASISSDIANKRLENINKRSAKIAKEQAEAEAKEVPKGFHGRTKTRNQGELTERAKQIAKQNDGERRVREVKTNRANESVRKTTERSRIREAERIREDVIKLRAELKKEQKRASKRDDTIEGHARAVARAEQIQKALNVREAQLKSANKNTRAIQQKKQSGKRIFYHAGDLGKSEWYHQQAGSSRHTGHFGTGTYFGGSPDVLTDSYRGRPLREVDATDYNLYRPNDYDQGIRVHDTLKEINRSSGDMDSLLRKLDVSDEDITSMKEIVEGVEGNEFSHERARALDDVADKVLPSHTIEELRANAEAEAKAGEQRLKEKESVYREKAEKAEKKFEKEIDEFGFSLEDFGKTKEEKIQDYIESFKKEDSMTADEHFFYALSDRLIKELNDDMGFGKTSFVAKVTRSRKIVPSLAKDLGKTEKEVREAIAEASERIKGYSGVEKADSASTIIMKKLGFEGVDVSGIKGLDNTSYGSVIYDLKQAGDVATEIAKKAEAKVTEVAGETVRKVKAESKAKPNAEPPKTKAHEEPKAKTREEELKAEQDQLHKDGGKLYNEWIEARRSGVGEEEAEKAYKANQDRQREIQEELNGKPNAKDDTNFASFTGKEAEDELERANLRSLSKEDSDIVGEVTKKSKEGTEVAVPKTRKLNEDGKSISAETGGTKKPLSLRFREMVSDNFAYLEDIANKLPDKQRQAMLSAINEVRKASKTARAIVAEKGRSIYSDFGLTKRGKKVAKKREEFEEVCFLEHELDRKKAGSPFTDMSREDIYAKLHTLKEKYATNVKRDSDGNIVFNKDGTTELLDASGKGTGKFAKFDTWQVFNEGGELIPNTHLDDLLETELHNAKGTGFQDRMVKYFRDLLDREVDAGIITKAQALEHIKNYPHYVPSYRADKFDDILRNSTVDEINIGRGLKEAKGGSDRALVPLYNQMQVKTNMALKRAELNKMLNLLATASGTTEKELDDLVPWFKSMDGEQKTEALMDAQYFTREAEGKHYAVIYRNGQEIKISLDKEAFEEVRRWSGEDRKNMTIARMFLEKAIDNKAIGWANSTFKKWITDYNLVFGLKNLGRDTATALFYTKDLKGFVKNMPKGFALSILPDSVGRKCMKNWDQYKKAYQVYKENGGIISQFIARDSASDTFFDSANKLNPFKWVENFNSALETMPRMTEFLSVIDAKAMKAGGDYDKAFEKILKNQDDIAEAMYRAKDVTLNFDRSGWLGAKLNRGIVPFFNPASQGISKLYRVMVRDNIKYGEKGIIAQKETLESFVKMGGYLGAMVVAPAMAFDAVPLPVKAEDGKHHTIGEYINGEVKGYEKQSDYNRYANYLIPIGDGKFLKIPRARELASLQSVLDYAYDNMMFGSGSKWDNLFKDRSVRDMKSLWETGIMAQIGPLTPWEDSLVAPIFRVRRNETWYGGKIESGTADAMHREAGEYSKIWDENTSRPAKYIGEKFNISPKKVDNVMDSYLGIIYDMGISQTSAKTDFLQVADENGGMLSAKGAFKGITSLTRSSWGRAFLIDSVFANANKSDYYNVANKRDKELSKLKEGTDEYNKVKAEIAKDKNAYSYTSCQYDELQANIWTDKNLTMSQKKKYARMLKQEDNSLWRDRKGGKTAPSKDPMDVAWNMKDGNGKRIMSTKTIIESCSYTNQKTGKNEIKDAYDSYHALGGKSDRKFMEVTLKARDVQREAGDSLSSPRWEVIAYSSVLNKIAGGDKVLKAYIEKDKNRNHLIGNAQIYMDHDGSIKNYKVMRKALTQGAYDLGYDYVSEARDGEATMILANARTKKGKKYRDLAYQANDWYIMDRMNAGRCLDAKKNGHYQAKDIKHICDKYKLEHDDKYNWDTEKVVNAINKEHPKASNEVKSAMFVVITGKMDGNPFGEIGDYSLGSDTGVYTEGGFGWYRRGRRGRRGWGHGGGRGGRGSAFEPIVNTAGSKLKVTDTSKKKSNLDNAYRKNLKKLREQTRAK